VETELQLFVGFSFTSGGSNPDVGNDLTYCYRQRSSPYRT